MRRPGARAFHHVGLAWARPAPSLVEPSADARVDALLAELYGVPDFAAFAKSEDVSKQQ